MKAEYERLILNITEFEVEDVITTSGSPEETTVCRERENVYRSYKSINDMPGAWF